MRPLPPHPLPDGSRVYVPELDVFARIASQAQTDGERTYTVVCEPPMPGWSQTFTPDQLRLPT